MKTLLLVLILCSPIFPCGVPSDVYGKIETRSFSYVTLRPVDSLLTEIRFLSPFGNYRFEDVTPCVVYQLEVVSRDEYDSPVFLVHSDDVEITLSPL